MSLSKLKKLKLPAKTRITNLLSGFLVWLHLSCSPRVTLIRNHKNLSTRNQTDSKNIPKPTFHFKIQLLIVIRYAITLIVYNNDSFNVPIMDFFFAIPLTPIANRSSFVYVPFDSVCGSDHVSVVHQRSAAIKSIEIRQPNHPRKFIRLGWFSANDSRVFISDAASYTFSKIYLFNDRNEKKKSQKTLPVTFLATFSTV